MLPTTHLPLNYRTTSTEMMRPPTPTASIAESLVVAGVELYAKGCDEEALRMFDIAFSVVKSPSEHVCKVANELLKVGCELLLVEDIGSRLGSNGESDDDDDDDDHPDLYQEDECDVGPRVLRSTIRPTAHDVSDPLLLEASILFNKAVTCHSLCRHMEAKQLYQTILSTLHTLLAARVGGEPTRLLMELGMRTENNMGFIYYCEGDEDMAIASFDSALVFARHLIQLRKDRSMEYSTVLSNLCRVTWMRGDIGNNLYKNLHELLRFRSSFLPWDHADVAASHYNLAVAEYARQQSASAIPHLKQYLEVCASQRQNGKANLDPIPGLMYLILIKNEDSDDRLAQELVRGVRTLQDKRQDQGPRSSEVASVLNYIGTMLFHQQDFENALLFFQEELRLEDNLTDSFSDVSTSVTCNNIGRILQELGKYEEAISYYQRALKSQYGDVSKLSSAKGSSKLIAQSFMDKIDAAASSANLYSTVWYNLGLIHDKLGSYDDAIFAFEMSHGLRRAMLGPDHPDIACLLYNIGVLRMERQQLEEATVCFREALRVRRIGAVGQLNDRHVVKTLEKLASLHRAKGNIKAALEACREVLSIQEVSVDFSGLSRHKAMGVTFRSMAELYQAIGDMDAALETANASVQSLRSVADKCRRKNGGPNGSRFEQASDVEQFASSLLLLGSLFHEMCEPIHASVILREAAVIIEEATTTTSNCNSSSSTLCGMREVAYMLATSHCAPEA
jgi:tetratricopeptide (TPR) repeat protein